MKQKLLIMLQMQNEMNVKVHPQWVSQGFEWYRAIWIECAELMDHYGWKWWKKQNPDQEQVILELIDIWHFGLSAMLQTGETPEVLADQLAQQLDLAPSDVAFLLAIETFSLSVLQTRQFDVKAFAPLLVAMDLDVDSLFRGYVGKNVLNFFRQDYGYKDGSYIKVWQGREDNEHLVEILQTLDSDSLSFRDDVYKALALRYPVQPGGRDAP